MMAAENLCGIAPLAAVLRLAQQYPVFPCRRHAETVTINGRQINLKPKSPLTTRGFLDATQDEAQIRTWWSRWPEALVGVPTGQGTKLVVVDYDHGKVDQAAQDWIGEHSNDLLSTRTHSTFSGGKHYLYRNPDGRKYRSSVCLTLGGIRRQGIDSRAEGGYIVWWPLHGGDRSGTIAPLPAGLIDEYQIEDRPPTPLPTVSPEKWDRDRGRVQSALAYVDPTDYRVWQPIGSAIHLASGGSDDGFELWHAWSSGGITGETPRNYAGIDDCRLRWASFHHNGERISTLGTVFHHAQQAGWSVHGQPPEQELPPLEDDSPEWIGPGAAAPVEPAINRLIEAGFWAGKAENHTDLPYLVKGLFDRGQMIVLWGPPGSGKTFAALSLAAHIGSGNRWAGRRVKKGRVLYVCAESTRKRLENRTRALLDAYPELADTELFLVPLTLDLLNGDQDIVAVLAACEQMEDVALIVVDTLAVTFGGGDENSPEDMGKYVSNMKLLKDRTGAAILIVHHCGKDEARGMRGHSSLLGALDGELAVERPDPKQPRIFKAGKLREGESFCDLFTFNLDVKTIGLDPDGDLVTTCVVVPVSEGGVTRRPKQKTQLALLAALEDQHRGGNAIWVEAEIREIAGGLMHRNSVRAAIFGLNEAGWLKASVGGWALTQEPK